VKPLYRQSRVFPSNNFDRNFKLNKFLDPKGAKGIYGNFISGQKVGSGVKHIAGMGRIVIRIECTVVGLDKR
jgi:hypothetical protein